MRWVRYVGWTVSALVLLLAAITAVAGFTAWQSSSFRDLYVGRSKHNLTAAECLKGKGACNLAWGAPIGALAEYRRCGGDVSGSRAKGEPLACSEQGITDLLLSDWFRQGQSAYRQLRRGCRVHDLCYRHGSATYGLTRPQCDQEFLAESLRECRLIYGKDEKFVWNRDPLRWSCQVRASTAYVGVSLFGQSHFEGPMGSVCEYEGGPHAARDQVVAGRFLGGERDKERDYVISLSLVPDQNALAIRLLSFGSDGQSQEEAVERLSPDTVSIGDREWACQRRRTATGGFAADCPERLGQSMFKHAVDWLRFAPIVVDADGDGVDELVIPSVMPDFGLIFTHIRARRDPSGIRFEPVRAFLGAARMVAGELGKGGCEAGLEFANCDTDTQSALPEVLSNDKATQNAGYQFTVIANVDAGCLAPNKQDIVLLSAYSDFPKQPTPEVVQQGGWDGGYVLRRFLFDADARHWHMRRDKFNNDMHRLVGCNLPNRDQFQTHARLQYPSFVVRMPGSRDPRVAGASNCAPDERLALISRDKCPTTTPASKAGNLNDIDLMLYEVTPNYLLASDPQKISQWPKDRAYDELRMAKAKWMPILWGETADPVLTSRAAREHGIAMVSSFIGGTHRIGGDWSEKGRPGHYPVIAVLRTEQLKSPKFEWQHRYADTVGYTPDLYGVFKSSRFKTNSLEGVFNLWAPNRYGLASTYYRIPAVLAPFTATGGKGVSLVFFANRALWADPANPALRNPALVPLSKALPIQDGQFRLMILPIPVPGPTVSGLPAMIDCPADAIADGQDKPAAPLGNPHFLRREPVLAGKFFESDTGGSLAVAWREATGGVRLTGLRYDAEKKTWKFGNKACGRPVGMAETELYRDKIN